MERDFLCSIGSGALLKDEGRAEPADYPGDGGGTAMRWQFPAKSGAAPAYMSFRTPREDGSKEFSISGFRPPAAVRDGITSSPVTSQQRMFGFDAPQQQQYSHCAQGFDHSGATNHLLGGSRMVQPLPARHPVPFSQGNPMPGPFSQANPMLRTQSLHNASGGMFKTQPFIMSNSFGGSTVGAYGARNPHSQNSTQLTIFYNGTVNVFDNVSVEKAQEFMLLASKASTSSPPSVVRKPDSPISAPAKINVPEALPISTPAKINVPEVLPARQIVTQKPESSVSHLATTSSPISIMPQAVALSRSTSNGTIDSSKPKTTVVQPPVVVPTNQASSSQATPLATTSAATVIPRAVPQARKASLSRFLERRKDRVTSVEPYPTSKSPLESNAKGSANALSKSSSGVAPATNSGEEPLRFGQPRNISFSTEACPSTKLQI